jgi:hypothetical protein
MRWLLGIVAAVSLLWLGYWFAATTAIRRGVEGFLVDQPAGAVRVEASAVSVGGFPYRFDLALDGVQVADPVSGAGYAGTRVEVATMAWKPWHLVAALPPDQILRLPGEEIALTGTGIMASLRARPALDLPLADARVAGQEIGLASSAGWQSGAGNLVLALQQAETGPADYALGLLAEGVRIDPAFGERLAAVTLPDQPASDLPDTAGPLRANILLHFTAPIDRNYPRVQPRLKGLDIGELHLEWGALVVEAAGHLAADAQGYAAGEVKLTITNWDRLPALLVALGLVKPEVGPTVAGMMKALAGQTGDPALLQLPLKLSDGQMSLGPFPLGPAPLLLPRS